MRHCQVWFDVPNFPRVPVQSEMLPVQHFGAVKLVVRVEQSKEKICRFEINLKIF